MWLTRLLGHRRLASAVSRRRERPLENGRATRRPHDKRASTVTFDLVSGRHWATIHRIEFNDIAIRKSHAEDHRVRTRHVTLAQPSGQDQRADASSALEVGFSLPSDGTGLVVRDNIERHQFMLRTFRSGTRR
ncbi:hypothetical protein C9J85_01315 [Haloferax sp. wsp5]|nr:hypothetical protein C9J85_01315 [Haloferax sp. wsp5]